MIMIFAFFHLLLFSLLISFSCSVLPQAGEPVCVKAAGNANLQHCNEIIAKQMPEENPARDARYTFMHGQLDCDGSLPAYLRRRNCLIIVNAFDNSLIASGDWKALRDQASKLVATCVGMNRGAGGHLRMANGLFLALWQPSTYVAMAQSTGGFVPQCLTYVRPNGPNWNPGSTQTLRRRNESSETD